MEVKPDYSNIHICMYRYVEANRLTQEEEANQHKPTNTSLTQVRFQMACNSLKSKVHYAAGYSRTAPNLEAIQFGKSSPAEFTPRADTIFLLKDDRKLVKEFRHKARTRSTANLSR